VVLIGAVRVPVRVPVPGSPAAAGRARPRGGEGVPFGSRPRLAIPVGAVADSTRRFRGLSCTGGWAAERLPAP
jgi:hypothetical protein